MITLDTEFTSRKPLEYQKILLIGCSDSLNHEIARILAASGADVIIKSQFDETTTRSTRPDGAIVLTNYKALVELNDQSEAESNEHLDPAVIEALVGPNSPFNLDHEQICVIHPPNQQEEVIDNMRGSLQSTLTLTALRRDVSDMPNAFRDATLPHPGFDHLSANRRFNHRRSRRSRR